MHIQSAHFSRTPNKNQFNVKLHFYGKSPEVLPPGFVFGPTNGGSSWLLQYCATGCGIMEVEGKEIPLKKGECIVTFPGQHRIERADAKDPWCFLWIALLGESAQKFFEKMDMTPENPILQNCIRSNIPLLLEQIIDTADTVGNQDDFLLGVKLFTFFDECLRFHAETKNRLQTGRVCENYVAQAARYMDMHYTRDSVTIASLAKQLGLNRSYFYEIFKEIKGVSPQEYLTQLRIRKACTLLQIPGVSVTKVASSVGYEPSVFSKAFKRVMGMNPAEYKKNYK